MAERPPLAGVLAPLLTPFDARLDPDAQLFVEHARRLLADGCRFVVPFGTTGEASSLALTERIALLEALLDGGVPAARLVVGTGSCSLTETVELTRRAFARGCRAALVLPPFYFKPLPESALLRYFTELIERLADHRGGLILYHIPRLSGVPIEPALLDRLAERFPDRIAGVKDSSGCWETTRAFLERRDRLAVFAGSEEHLTRVLSAGGAGCISATANVQARALGALCDCWHHPRGEELQREATRRRRAIERFPLIAALKELIARCTGQAAWRRVRPPLEPLGERHRALLAELTPESTALRPLSG